MHVRRLASRECRELLSRASVAGTAVLSGSATAPHDTNAAAVDGAAGHPADSASAPVRRVVRPAPAHAPDPVIPHGVHPPGETSVDRARALTRAAVHDWGVRGVCDDALGCVFEFATDAVAHAVPTPASPVPGRILDLLRDTGRTAEGTGCATGLADTA